MDRDALMTRAKAGHLKSSRVAPEQAVRENEASVLLLLGGREMHKLRTGAGSSDEESGLCCHLSGLHSSPTLIPATWNSVEARLIAAWRSGVPDTPKRRSIDPAVMIATAGLPTPEGLQ